MDRDARLADLEVRYMHLEKLVDQLNEVVTEQQGVLDRLVRDVRTLREAASSGQADEGTEPPPPHY